MDVLTFGFFEYTFPLSDSYTNIGAPLLIL
jgi:hypothetical protein